MSDTDQLSLVDVAEEQAYNPDDPIHFHVYCTAEDCEFDAQVAHEYQAADGKSRHETRHDSDHRVEIDAKQGSVEFTTVIWHDVEGL